ncbi:MAG: carboxypeptidase regulatory-like domain-containing protein [Candidatus Aenigmarchaeota archaeon]|nr:carboxypeptidase regulatory-like domain-containing protein [Candidatus Aenigmarchaeota archaeon]
MKKKELLFVLMIATLVVVFSNNSLAVSIEDLSFSGGNEYYVNGDHFTASFYCSGDDYQRAEINISKGSWYKIPSPDDIVETPSGDKVQISYNVDPNDLDGTGTYTFEARCVGNNTDASTKTFNVYDYELHIQSPTTPSNYVEGDYLTVTFTFKKKIGNNEYNVDDAKFDVLLSKGGQEIVLTTQRTPSKTSDGLEITVLIPSLPTGTVYGPYDLVVEYSPKPTVKDTVADVVNLEKAFSISFEDSSPIQMSDGGSVEMPVLVTSPLLTSENLQDLMFKVTIDDYKQTIDSTDMQPCSVEGTNTYRCVLPVSIPDEDPGSYDLTVRGIFQSYSDEVSKKVEFTIPFKGVLAYASGQIVDATIQLQNLETGKWYKTTVNKATGQYSLDLLPGTYKLKLTSPVIDSVEINGVKIDENSAMITSKNPIMIDSFVAKNKIPGIDCVKVVVLEFALDFDDAEIWMSYDDTDVKGDESDLELYQCHQWNFGQRTCTGEWKSIPFDVNTVANLVHFNTTQLSAFILGNKKAMGLEVTMDRDEYYSGEPITFSGNVIDSDGNAVKNAKVSYTIEGTNLTGSTYTDQRGYFVASDLIAPKDEGIYKMEITVEKNPYKTLKSDYTLKIKKKVDFSLIVPDEVTVNIDESKQAKLTLVNTGQKNFTSISVSLRGIPTDWYSIVPMSVDNLGIGDEKTITLTFKVPSDACKEKCQIYHFVDVVAKASNGIEKTKSFTLQINQTAPITTSSGFEGFSLPSLPTGKILSLPSNPYVGATLFVVILFLIVAILKTKRGGGQSYKFRARRVTPKFFRLSPPSGQVGKNLPREKVVPVLHNVKENLEEMKLRKFKK